MATVPMRPAYGPSSDRPLVSVVVPSFNQAPFIREALDSVLAQDYPNREVLVMDGGSTDGTLAILRSYNNNIRFVAERDRGQANAINKGLGLARGSVVAWLNSDDRYVPGAIAHAVDALELNSSAGMVYGEGEIIDRDGHVLGPFEATQRFDLWTLIHVSDFIMQPTVFMRSDCVREVGGLDESLHYGLDWDLWIRLASRRPVEYVPKVLAQTREYGETKTATGGWSRLRELKSIMNRHGAEGWPPGAVAYGLDTLRLLFPRVFGPSSLGARATLRGPLPRLFRPIRGALSWVMTRHAWRIPMVWRDRWMGPEGHLALPWDGTPSHLRVTLEKDEEENWTPFYVQIRTAAQSATAVAKLPGRFEGTIQLPGGTPRILEVALRASRHQPFRKDPRRISCRFVDARLEPLANAFLIGGSQLNP